MVQPNEIVKQPKIIKQTNYEETKQDYHVA